MAQAAEADAEAGVFSDGEGLGDDASLLRPLVDQDRYADGSLPLRRILLRSGVVAACSAAALLGVSALAASSAARRRRPMVASRSVVSNGSPQLKAWFGWPGGDDDEQSQAEQERSRDEEVEAGAWQQQVLEAGYDYPSTPASTGPLLHDTDRLVDTPMDTLSNDGGAYATAGAYAGDGGAYGGVPYLGQALPAGYSWSDPYASIRSDPDEMEALHPKAAAPEPVADAGMQQPQPQQPQQQPQPQQQLPQQQPQPAVDDGSDYKVRTDASEEAALHILDDRPDDWTPLEPLTHRPVAEIPTTTLRPPPSSSSSRPLRVADIVVRPGQKAAPTVEHESNSFIHDIVERARQQAAVEAALKSEDDQNRAVEVRAGLTFTKTTSANRLPATPAPTLDWTPVLQTTPVPQTTVTTMPALDALFCFAVMLSNGYELPLMQEQLFKGAGIFGCERFAVLSDAEVPLTSDALATTILTESIGDLHCQYGGPYNLALNSDVFVRAWKRVFQDGFYRFASWTVKADPDAVFLPSRLRRLVSSSDADAKVYLNNCDTGLHGPIEVISLGGMKVFDANVSDCVNRLSNEFSWAGEDVFLRHCLGYLQVDRVDSFNLLKEDHCFNKNPRADGCFTGEVSFHPFKDNAGWFACLAQAEDGSKQQPMSASDAAKQQTIVAKRRLQIFAL